MEPPPLCMCGSCMEAWIRPSVPLATGLEPSLSSLQSGEIEIVNHKTGDKCNLKFVPYSYFSRDVARKVGRGTTRDNTGMLLISRWA